MYRERARLFQNTCLRAQFWGQATGQGERWLAERPAAGAARSGEVPSTPAVLTVTGSAPRSPRQRTSEPVLARCQSASSQNRGQRGVGTPAERRQKSLHSAAGVTAEAATARPGLRQPRHQHNATCHPPSVLGSGTHAPHSANTTLPF